MNRLKELWYEITEPDHFHQRSVGIHESVYFQLLEFNVKAIKDSLLLQYTSKVSVRPSFVILKV